MLSVIFISHVRIPWLGFNEMFLNSWKYSKFYRVILAIWSWTFANMNIQKIPVILHNQHQLNTAQDADKIPQQQQIKISKTITINLIVLFRCNITEFFPKFNLFMF